jgi:hypothetical protein
MARISSYHYDDSHVKAPFPVGRAKAIRLLNRLEQTVLRLRPPIGKLGPRPIFSLPILAPSLIMPHLKDIDSKSSSNVIAIY